MNPGNLDSELYRSVDDQKGLKVVILRTFIKQVLYPQVYGAYTELFSGLSPQVTMDKTGSWSKLPCSFILSY